MAVAEVAEVVVAAVQAEVAAEVAEVLHKEETMHTFPTEYLDSPQRVLHFLSNMSPKADI